jgi:hypothetical protein
MKPNFSVDQYVYDDAIVVNFDGVSESGLPTHQGGYLRIIKDDECQCFNIIVFNKHGDVIIETDVEFDFEPIEE